MTDEDGPKLVDKMLQKLVSGHQCIGKQNAIITDIIEKSNNVLLQIEATRAASTNLNNSNSDQNVMAYTFDNDTIKNFTKYVELFQQWLNPNKVLLNNVDELSFETFLQNNKLRAEYLNGSVRKLLAVVNTVTQMQVNLMNQDEKHDSNDFDNSTA